MSIPSLNMSIAAKLHTRPDQEDMVQQEINALLADVQKSLDTKTQISLTFQQNAMPLHAASSTHFQPGQKSACQALRSLVISHKASDEERQAFQVMIDEIEKTLPSDTLGSICLALSSLINSSGVSKQQEQTATSLLLLQLSYDSPLDSVMTPILFALNDIVRSPNTTDSQKQLAIRHIGLFASVSDDPKAPIIIRNHLLGLVNNQPLTPEQDQLIRTTIATINKPIN